MTALVDTGAYSSLLRQDIFTQIVNTVHRRFLLRPSSKLRGVSGAQLDVIGRTYVHVDNVKC